MFYIVEKLNVLLITAIVNPLSGVSCITNNCFKPMFNTNFGLP